MQTFSFTLPLIINRDLPIFRFLAWGTVVCLAFVVLSIFIWSGEIIAVFLIIAAIMGFILGIIRGYDVIGQITLTQDEIIVKVQDEKLVFCISGMKNWEILSSEVDGEFYGSRTALSKQGMNGGNVISILCYPIQARKILKIKLILA